MKEYKVLTAAELQKMDFGEMGVLTWFEMPGGERLVNRNDFNAMCGFSKGARPMYPSDDDTVAVTYEFISTATVSRLTTYLTKSGVENMRYGVKNKKQREKAVSAVLHKIYGENPAPEEVEYMGQTNLFADDEMEERIARRVLKRLAEILNNVQD